jgi:hypothetical protein
VSVVDPPESLGCVSNRFHMLKMSSKRQSKHVLVYQSLSAPIFAINCVCGAKHVLVERGDEEALFLDIKIKKKVKVCAKQERHLTVSLKYSWKRVNDCQRFELYFNLGFFFFVFI